VSEEFVIQLGQQAIWVALKVCGPILALGLVVGLLVSIFQAATQIQEQTLAFIPKILAVIVALIFFGPWMLTNLLEFARRILGDLSAFVK
jgi:flagellar biosynthetic protein FliQ